MFQPSHCGLFFGPDQIRLARQHRERPPFQSAWGQLTSIAAAGLWAAQRDGLLYRFDENVSAGRMAAAELERALERDDWQRSGDLDALGETVIAAQVFELVRDHPDLAPQAHARLCSLFAERMDQLDRYALERTYIEHLWLALVRMALGVVLERETWLHDGVVVFQRVIAEDVHPRGHIIPAVATGDGTSMEHTLLAVEALVLMAAAARQTGLDLWSYEVRGVSVLTAALYPIYYFYVTDKWTWDALTPEQVQSSFRRHGGYLEIVNQQAQPRDFKPLLEDLRPIYDPYAGGVTTLTHGLPLKRGLFG